MYQKITWKIFCFEPSPREGEIIGNQNALGIELSGIGGRRRREEEEEEEEEEGRRRGIKQPHHEGWGTSMKNAYQPLIPHGIPISF